MGESIYNRPARPFELWNIGNYETVYLQERTKERLAFVPRLPSNLNIIDYIPHGNAKKAIFA